MLGFALLARGLETGRHRVAAAVVIALSALSHGIVLIFVFGGAALMLVVWNKREVVLWLKGDCACNSVVVFLGGAICNESCLHD